MFFRVPHPIKHWFLFAPVAMPWPPRPTCATSNWPAALPINPFVSRPNSLFIWGILVPPPVPCLDGKRSHFLRTQVQWFVIHKSAATPSHIYIFMNIIYIYEYYIYMNIIFIYMYIINLTGGYVYNLFITWCPQPQMLLATRIYRRWQ